MKGKTGSGRKISAGAFQGLREDIRVYLRLIRLLNQYNRGWTILFLAAFMNGGMPVVAIWLSAMLLDALYAVRRDLARREKLPAFMIFPDAVLRDICQRRPRTTADLLAISGIGEVKAARYGPAFLEAVRKGG